MRARTATFFSAVALASATLGTGTAMADASCVGADATPGTVPATVTQTATLCLLNQQRAAAGLVPLVEQTQLDAVSTAYSQAMVDGQFFAHVSPDGSTMTSRVTASGYLSQYGAWSLGENIAWGSGTLATPTNIVIAWMNSEGHRENILDPKFREIGIGVVTGAPVPVSAAGATYTTDFGVRSAPRGGAVADPGHVTTTPGTTTTTASGAAATPAATGAVAKPTTGAAGSKPTADAKKAASKKARAAKRAAAKKRKAQAAKARRAARH